MISVKPLRSNPIDTLRRHHDDAFGADESGVRWDLVGRVRQAIENGSYDEDSRVDALLDRLAADLDL